MASKLIKGKNPRKPYTVRYWHDGRQREKSFAKQRDAKDFMAEFENDSREGKFVDPKLGKERFGVAATGWIDRHQGAPSTKRIYRSVLRNQLTGLSGRTLRQVSQDRAGVEDLLRDIAADKSVYTAGSCRSLITAVIGDAVRTGKLANHRLERLVIPQPKTGRAQFYFPTYAEVATAAEAMGEFGLAVWLARLCGLRVGEALGLRREDFHEGVLRLERQRRADSSVAAPKHRRQGEFRDVPLPAEADRMVADYVTGRDRSHGELFPPWHRSTFDAHWRKAREAAGLPYGFRVHDLRHAYASACLSSGVAITDLSHWLGHSDIRTTYRLYSHMVPPALEAGRVALDGEFQRWRTD